MSKTSKVDPLIRAAKAAYRKSDQARLDKLIAEERRWKRKRTLAGNKLEEVRYRINWLCAEIITKAKE